MTFSWRLSFFLGCPFLVGRMMSNIYVSHHCSLLCSCKNFLDFFPRGCYGGWFQYNPKPRSSSIKVTMGRLQLVYLRQTCSHLTAFIFNNVLFIAGFFYAPLNYWWMPMLYICNQFIFIQGKTSRGLKSHVIWTPVTTKNSVLFPTPGFASCNKNLSVNFWDSTF